jgi:plastocyanin
MAAKTKTKKTVKKTRKSTSSSPHANHVEQSNFLIIVGGGFLVIVIGMLLLFNNGSSSVKRAMTGTTPQAQAQATLNTVTIQNFAYSPSVMKVKVGTTVTWENQDSTEHSATADDGSFDTKMLSLGEKGSYTFTKAGTYTYHCSSHPSMTGTIIVEE